MNERRGLERFILKLPVVVIDVNAKTEEKILTSDISSKGVFVSTKNTKPEGTHLDLAIRIVNDRSVEKESKAIINVSGQVIRQEAEGMAVLFYNNYSILPD